MNYYSSFFETEDLEAETVRPIIFDELKENESIDINNLMKLKHLTE